MNAKTLLYHTDGNCGSAVTLTYYSESDVALLNDTIGYQQQMIRDLKAKTSMSDEDIARLNNTIGMLNQRIDDRIKACQRAGQRIDELTGHLQKAETNLRGTEAALHQANSAYAGSRNLVAALQTELGNLASLKGAYNILMKEHQESLNLCTRYKTRAERAEAEFVEQQARENQEITELRHALVTGISVRDRLSKEVCRLQNQLQNSTNAKAVANDLQLQGSLVDEVNSLRVYKANAEAALTELRKQLAERDVLVNRAQVGVAHMNQRAEDNAEEITLLSLRLTERAELLAAEKERTKGLKERIQELELELKLSNSDQALAGLRKVVVERNGQVSHLNAVLHDKEDHIGALKTQVKELLEKVASLEKILTRNEHELEALKVSHRELERALRETMKERNGAIDHATELQKVLRKEKTDAEAQATLNGVTLKELQSENMSLRSDYVAMAKTLQETLQELSKLKASGEKEYNATLRRSGWGRAAFGPG